MLSNNEDLVNDIDCCCPLGNIDYSVLLESNNEFLYVQVPENYSNYDKERYPLRKKDLNIRWDLGGRFSHIKARLKIMRYFQENITKQYHCAHIYSIGF